MLVGHPPYRAEDQIAVALQHVQAPLPELPDELLHLQPLMRCALAKDPDRRWSDGREMANALRAAAADYPDVPGETVILSAGSLYVLPEHAADHKKSRFAQRWNGRWGLWLAGMLALGILVSGLLAAWGRYRENRSWDLAQSAQTPAAVLAYLNRYPDGKWALEAQTWMNRWRTDQGESAREGAEAQPVGQEKNDRGEAEHPSEEIKAGQKPPVLPPSGAGRSVKKREEPMPQGGLSERALSLPEVRRLIDHTRISLEAWRVQRTPLGAQVEDQARRIAWLFPFRKDVSLSRERVERRLYLMNRRAPRRTRWRLPTVGEALRLSAYVRLQKDWGAVGMVWTADQQGGGRSWVVDLDKGAVFGQEHGKTYRFRPVRSLP